MNKSVSLLTDKTQVKNASKVHALKRISESLQEHKWVKLMINKDLEKKQDQSAAIIEKMKKKAFDKKHTNQQNHDLDTEMKQTQSADKTNSLGKTGNFSKMA